MEEMRNKLSALKEENKEGWKFYICNVICTGAMTAMETFSEILNQVVSYAIIKATSPWSLLSSKSHRRNCFDRQYKLKVCSF